MRVLADRHVSQQVPHSERDHTAALVPGVAETDALGARVGPDPHQGVVALLHCARGEGDAALQGNDARRRFHRYDSHRGLLPPCSCPGPEYTPSM